MDSSLTGLDMLGAFQWLGARQYEVCSFVALWHGPLSMGPLDSSFCKLASRCHQGLVADDLNVWVFITQQ